jgi:hypothetical protein
MATAKHRGIDRLRRAEVYQRKTEELGRDAEPRSSPEDDLVAAADDPFDDDLLRLIFTACHPVLATDARVALTLALTLQPTPPTRTTSGTASHVGPTALVSWERPPQRHATRYYQITQMAYSIGGVVVILVAARHRGVGIGRAQTLPAHRSKAADHLLEKGRTTVRRSLGRGVRAIAVVGLISSVIPAATAKNRTIHVLTIKKPRVPQLPSGTP